MKTVVPRFYGLSLEKRRVLPELLDHLPPSDPEAVRSRRDLRIINRFMRSEAWFRQQLAALPMAKRRVIELGAGTGDLAKGLRSKLPGLSWTGLDLLPRPADWPADWQWTSGNFLDAPDPAAVPNATVAAGCLIFHHFEAPELRRLGERIAASGVRHVFAFEPARRRRHLAALQLGRLIRFSPVTLHDGAVSIGGGFRGDELPQLLGLDSREWNWRCDLHIGGAYRMVAHRR